ncbi:MAG: helix-turn-helix transcriptional regulator [Defluviitaleaceae bacterium]|nr:helix-turn-helix transcriptional regulator [Defluviitaleaceae bacterium]
MTTLDKIIAIRKNQGLTKTELANAMNFHRSYVSLIESKQRKMPPDYIARFKEALDAPDLPFNKKEERDFLTKLHDWREVVFREDVSEAAKTYPIIARIAALTVDSNLRILCQLFTLSYYRISKEINKYDALYNEVKMQVNAFNDEHKYWFYRQSGNRYMHAYQYRSALDAYFIALECMTTLGYKDESIYFNIGHCLTDMGYASRALEYFEKSQALSKSKRTNNDTEYFIATNYIHMGRTAEALEKLEDCLDDEKQKKDKDLFVGVIYEKIGIAHAHRGNHSAALAAYETALPLRSPHAYPYTLYYKTISLMGCNRKAEALQCLEEGIASSKTNTKIYIMLRTLKCLYTFDHKDSHEYLVNESIPSLIKYEHNELLITCYQALGRHLKLSNPKQALDYITHACVLNEKLRKGDFM